MIHYFSGVNLHIVGPVTSTIIEHDEAGKPIRALIFSKEETDLDIKGYAGGTRVSNGPTVQAAEFERTRGVIEGLRVVVERIGDTSIMISDRRDSERHVISMHRGRW